MIGCRRSEDPEHSVADLYLCELDAAVPVSASLPNAADVPAGRSRFCFSIPRAASPMFRNDIDARPVYPLRAGRSDCFV